MNEMGFLAPVISRRPMIAGLAALAPILLGLPTAAQETSDGMTLVAWVAPANLTQGGGSVLTIQSGDQFDGIVLGERADRRWMAGSDYFRRTQDNQERNAAETTDAQTLVQIAIVYEAEEIQLYRNGVIYATYPAATVDLLQVDNHIAVFGLRHIGAGTGTPFAGAIEDARIYARALTQAEIAALQANKPSTMEPFAWWDFEGETVNDRAGRFGHSAMTGGVVLADGRLVLNGQGYLVAARSDADAARATRTTSPRAPYPPYVPETPTWPSAPPSNWLTFHLAHPGPGDAVPGDPNCAFDYRGRYHLHYIYRNRTGFVFAHVSSDDLVHWQWHPTVLAPPTTGHGMFSGTGFYTKAGKPAIIYHGEGSGHNWIQHALDDQFNTWSEPQAVIPHTADGQVPDIRHWDPDCWLNGDTYYALSGGQNPQLMKSTDLEHWTYLGDLLHPDYPNDLGVPKNEDISCANMFKIGSKWMLLCISHPLGCRYYLGDFQDEKYLPEFHAMMNWQKSGNFGFFFAPESMRTRDGRRVMWAWLFNGVSPSGIQSLPRELELPEDGVLRIKPLRELQTLRRQPQAWANITVRTDDEYRLRGVTGDALELELTFAAPLPGEARLSLFQDDDGEGGMKITVGANCTMLQVGDIQAPLQIQPNEDVTLRVFIDKNLVEVFANDRQAVAYAHEHIRKDPDLRLSASGGDASVRSLKVWRMQSIHESDAAAQ